MPKISVLMAAYNETDEQVNAALASIVAQTETDFEILLVLDNPTNEPLKALLTDWQARDDRIKLLINPTNLGLAASLNKGLAAATAPYIARMDADDIAKPERFATQLTLMDAHDFDALSTNAQFIDEAGQVVGEHNWIPETPEGLAQLLPYGSNLIHPSMMLKRSVMTDLGGYRALPTAEDYDLWLRFLKTGHQIGATNQQLMQYRLRGNSMTQGDRFKVFLVTQYLQAAYRRDQYPDADTEATEIQAYLKAHGAMDKQKADRFSQRVINLSAGKKALQQKHVFKAIGLVVPALLDKDVRAYAQQSRQFNAVYAELRRRQ